MFNVTYISIGLAYAFQKYGENEISDFGICYDYGSIMRYDAFAFFYNGQRTIIPKQNNVQIGQRNQLSIKDAQKINKMYAC